MTRAQTFFGYLLLLLLVSGCAHPAPGALAMAEPGDADGDGKVDVWDVRSATRAVSNENLQVPDPANADVNQNGEVDQGDVEAIQKRLKGIPTLHLTASPAGADPVEQQKLVVGETITIRVSDGFLPLDIVGGSVRITSAVGEYDSGEQKLIHERNGRVIYFHWNTCGLKPASDYQVVASIKKKEPRPAATIAKSAPEAKAQSGEQQAAPKASPEPTQTSADSGEDSPDEAETPKVETYNIKAQISLAPRDREDTILAKSTDVALPFWGIGLHMTRHYFVDSLHTPSDGPLGPGWTHAYNLRLSEDTDGSVYITGTGTSRKLFQPAGEGQYEAPAGAYAKLTRDEDGTFHLLLSNGDVWRFRPDLTPGFYADSHGHKVSFSFSEEKRLARAEDASGQFLQFEYNDDGKIVAVKSSTGDTVIYEYDQEGRLNRVKSAAHTLSYAYDDQDRLQEIRPASGEATRFAYDRVGRLKEVKEGPNYLRLSYVESPDGGTKRKVASSQGNWEEQISPDGLVIGHEPAWTGAASLDYDPKYRLLSVTDSQGDGWGFKRDAMDRVVECTDPDGNTMKVEYASESRLPLKITDANGVETNFRYLDTGPLTHQLYPDGTFTVRYYSEADGIHKIKRTERGGQTTVAHFDARGLLTQRQLPDGSQAAYKYDEHGNLIDAENAWGRLGFQYNKQGRLVKVSPPHTAAIQYEYDDRGNRVARLGPEGRRTEFRYDDQNRLTAIVGEGGKVIAEYEYKDGRDPVRRVLANRIETRYTYDEKGHLVGLEHHIPGPELLARWQIKYDGSGRPVKVVSDTGEEVLSYDKKGQLTTVERSGELGEQIHYDPVGNRTAVTDGKNTIQYAANLLNGYTAVGNEVRSFDLNGNLNSRANGREQLAYEYDGWNQLVRVKFSGGEDISYVYDPLGRLAERATGGRTTRYLWEGQRLAMELDANDRPIANYLWAPQADLPLTISRADQDFFVLEDWRGNVWGITDSNGELVGAYDYSHFGVPFVEGKSLSSVAFRGKFLDPATGLYFMDNRWYIPEDGCFLQADPGAPLSGQHAYALESNCPYVNKGCNFSGIRPRLPSCLTSSSLNTAARNTTPSAALPSINIDFGHWDADQIANWRNPGPDYLLPVEVSR